MLSKLKETYENLDRKYNLSRYVPVILYLFFGVVTTIINIVSYALLARVLKIDYVISNIVAWLLAVIVAFITNKLYVFKDGADTKKGKFIEICKFFLLRVVTLLIDMLIMYVGISALHLDDILMKCIANVVVIITNYLFSKYLIFVKNKNGEIDDKIKSISLSFLILLGIAITTIFADLFIYLFKTSYLFTIIVSGILALTVIIILIKLKKIRIDINFHFIDIVFICFTSVLCILSIVYPDSFWDTRSYHIYISENPFADKINFDFFPGRTLNSFLFPLADRMNYIFRYFLGYRMGTILGYYLLIVMYYQLKKIIKGFVKDKVSSSAIGILAILPIISYSVLEQTGTYYIDNFSLVFLIEIIYTIFFEKDILKNRFKVYYISLIIGIIVGVKVSNAALLIPMFVYFMIKNIRDFKYLKFYDYIIAIILVILPFGVYAVDNYIQTGNIVYPYYNNIFKSEYFMESSWHDTKFGGNSLKEKILWPFYALVSPNRLYDYGKVDPIWYIGYFTILVLVLGYIVRGLVKLCTEAKKTHIFSIKENKLFTFSLVTLFMYVIWSFLLGGYVRYATIIPVCAYIVLITLFVILLEKRVVLGVILTSCVFGMSVCFSYKSYSVNKKSFIIYNIGNGFENACNIYKENFKMLLKDKSKTKIDLGENACFATLSDESASATLLRTKNTPIINISETFAKDERYGGNDKLSMLYDEKVQHDNMYIALNYTSIASKIADLNKFGFRIISTETLGTSDNLDIGEMMYIAKIKHVDGKDVNNSYMLIDKGNEFKVEFSDRESLNIAVAVFPKYLGEAIDMGNVEVYYINEEGKEVTLNNVILDGTQMVNLSIENTGLVDIYIRAKDDYRYIVFAS